MKYGLTKYLAEKFRKSYNEILGYEDESRRAYLQKLGSGKYIVVTPTSWGGWTECADQRTALTCLGRIH